MANEAVIVELLGNAGDPVSYIVADGTGIAKGSLMVLSGDRTIAVGSTNLDVFVGIAASEKVASDGETTLAVYTNGIFDITDQGAGISIGSYVKVGTLANNIVVDTINNTSNVVGLALETATGSEVIQIKVNK